MHINFYHNILYMYSENYSYNRITQAEIRLYQQVEYKQVFIRLLLQVFLHILVYITFPVTYCTVQFIKLCQWNGFFSFIYSLVLGYQVTFRFSESRLSGDFLNLLTTY